VSKLSMIQSTLSGMRSTFAPGYSAGNWESRAYYTDIGPIQSGGCWSYTPTYCIISV
jgi:hypothetical protein